MEGTPGTPSPGTAVVLARPTGTKSRDWPPAQRCGGERTDGGQCGRWAVRGGDRCPMHGGNRHGVRKAYADNVLAARLGVASLVDPAVEVLERAMASPDLTVAVRAAQAVLDRLVPRTGGTVQVGVAIGLGDDIARQDPTTVIRQRLAALRAEKDAPSVVGPTFAESLEQDTGEVLEGELVDDGADWS